MFTSTMESRQGCPYRLLAAMDYTTGPTPLHRNTFVGQLRAVVLQQGEGASSARYFLSQAVYGLAHRASDDFGTQPPSVAVSGACGKICFCQVDG
jgi:hypothetical protein